MVDAVPFAALRYDPAVAGDPGSTSAPAYDDLERFTYAQHRAASPYTVLELLTGEDAGSAEGYRTAAGTFSRWLRTSVLVQDRSPAYYLYEIHQLHHGVPTLLRGVLAAVAVRGNTLAPHEGVDPDRVASRVRRLQAVPAELAPVFAVHTPGPPALRAVLDGRPPSRPIVAFTDDSGSDHRVWALRDDNVMATVHAGLAEVNAVIADGHHRFAAAAARSEAARTPGRTLTFLVDSATYGPQLHPVHRIVFGPVEDIAARLAPMFSLQASTPERLDADLAEAPGTAFGVRLPGNRAAVLTARGEASVQAALPSARSAAWRRLASAVWEYAARPLLRDLEVGYRSDVGRGAAEVETTPGALFVLRPPSLEDVFACAFAGEAMPPKSTWFRPKPRAGLIMRSLDSPR